MIYYLDIVTRELSAEAGGLPITELTFKRRDTISFQLRWTADGGVVVGAVQSAKLGIKAAGAYASSFIASAPTMVQTDDDHSIFNFNFSLNTAEIDALFIENSDPSNVKAMLEIEWHDLDENIGSSKTVPVILTNDVIRGDEGPLAQANPDYPSATDVLTKSGNLSGLADPNSARSVLSVYSSAEVDAAVAAKAAVGSTVASDLGSTASAGSSQDAARADHVHRKPTLSELGAVSTTDSRLSDARTPVAHDASLITSGTISLSRLPALATSVQVVASGDMTTLTTEQQAQLVTGAIVTTSDGRRWLYKGTGTKTDTANYIEMGDITPEWTSIANKPSTFTPSAHTHPQSEITNLVSDLAARALATDVTTSLAGKSNVGHTHPTSDVTGLDTALASKRTILSGSGIPSAGTGSDGDLYIDTTGNKLYGPKASGAWGSGTFTQGSAGTGSTVSVQSANFTAAVGLRYVTTATLTVTDPTGSSAGQTYEVIVGAGTCTIGGSAYVASKIEIVRYYNGSAWITSPSTHSDNLTLNGTGNTAPNQGTTGANGLLVSPGSTSLLTSALFLPSYLELLANTYQPAFGATFISTSASVNTTLASSSGSNHRYGLNTTSTAGSYAGFSYSARPAAFYGGNTALPPAYYFLQAFTLNNLSYGASPDSYLVGLFKPTDSGCSVPATYSSSTSWITGVNNVQADGRWIVEVQAVSATSIRARLITQLNSVGTGGTPTIGAWITISLGSSTANYNGRLTLLVKQDSLTSISAFIGKESTGVYGSMFSGLGSNFTLIGSNTSWAQQPSNITTGVISSTLVGYSGSAVQAEVERATILLI